MPHIANSANSSAGKEEPSRIHLAAADGQVVSKLHYQLDQAAVPAGLRWNKPSSPHGKRFQVFARNFAECVKCASCHVTVED